MDAEITEAIIEAGARTYVAARNLEKLQTVADRLAQENLKVTPLTYDQGNPASVEAIFVALTNNNSLNPSGDRCFGVTVHGFE